MSGKYVRQCLTTCKTIPRIGCVAWGSATRGSIPSLGHLSPRLGFSFDTPNKCLTESDPQPMVEPMPARGRRKRENMNIDWGMTIAQIFLTTFAVFAGYGLGIQRGREIQRKIQQRIVARLMEH